MQEFIIRKGYIALEDSQLTGSLSVTNAVTASFFTGSFIGDGSQLSGVSAGFPFTGSAQITGSLGVTGSVTAISFIGDGSQLTGIDDPTPITATINDTNSPFTITSQSIVIIDSTNGGVTVNLPDLDLIDGTPDQKPILLYKNDYSQNVIFVNPSGSQLVNGTTQDIIVSIQIGIVYNPTSAGWVTEGTSYQSLAELELFFVPRTETGSLSVATASYVEYENVANKPSLISGSEQVTYSGLTGIPSGIVSGSEQVTYSGLTGIPSGILSGSAQIADFGIFATTGSNGFNGNQSITGSLTVTGQVVAQTLNVQQVTSSIVFSSGSNIFGNELGNTQQFTGSMLVTGSLTVAGAGTFSSSITATNNILINSGSASTASSGGILWLTTNNNTTRAAAIQAVTLSDDNAHDLLFYTNPTFSTPVERIRLTSTGNLGLGVTPNAWISGNLAFEIISASGLSSDGTSIRIQTNAFVNTSGNWQYKSNGAASFYTTGAGAHVWYNAPSGTAGNAISFTQAMTLDASGRLGIGTTSPSATLDVGSAKTLSGTDPISVYTDVRVASAVTGGLVGYNLRMVALAGSYTVANMYGIKTNTPVVQSGVTVTNSYGIYIGRTDDPTSGGVVTNKYALVTEATAGNVGIGIDSPANKLQVNVSSNTTSLYLDSSYPLMIKNTSTTDNSYVGMYFSTGLGIGATIQTLYTNASTRSEGNLLFSTRNSAGSIAERMRITSDGKVIVGASYMTYPVSIEAQAGGGQLALTRSGAVAEFYMGGTTGAATQLYVRSGGSGGVRLDTGATSWVSASDLRLKDIEKPIENAVESLSTLQTVYYSWKNSDNKSLHLGLIAQEVEAVFPEIVSESSIDEMKGVTYTELIPVLVKAIQEQQSQIEILKAEIQTLKQ